MRFQMVKMSYIPGIMEHIERAGVHSGDSMAVYSTSNIIKRSDG